MEHTHRHVDLGFADTKLPVGTHICQIYSDDEERDESLIQYLAAGLAAGECAACFSESVDEAELDEHCSRRDVSLPEAKESGAFELHGTSEVYFKDGRFDADRMLGLLKSYYDQSVAKGYPAARAIGEMMPEIKNIPGGERLMEYESRVTILLRDHPLTTVCQYNANDFDGATIMDVLKVHPMMVVRGTVVQNPFYILPEEFLGQK